MISVAKIAPALQVQIKQTKTGTARNTTLSQIKANIMA
jgi:hypothetical protein